MNELNIPPRPTRKTRARGAKPPIEARLLQASEKLLAEGYSFASMSVEQLAKEAGISRGTFYLHFKDKGELVGRLMDFFVDELAGSLGNWTQNSQAAEREDVMEAVRAMLLTFKKHEMIIIAVRDTMPHDRNVAETYDVMMQKIASMAIESAATVKSRGKSKPQTTKEVVDALAKLIVLYCTYLIDKDSGSSLDSISEALGHICVNTIFADNG